LSLAREYRYTDLVTLLESHMLESRLTPPIHKVASKVPSSRVPSAQLPSSQLPFSQPPSFEIPPPGTPSPQEEQTQVNPTFDDDVADTNYQNENENSQGIDFRSRCADSAGKMMITSMTSIRADMTELRCNLGWDRATSCTEGCHSKQDDAITTRWIEDQEQSSGVEAWCGVLEVLRQGLWDDMGLNGGV
jgi:hypothetical protein